MPSWPSADTRCAAIGCVGQRRSTSCRALAGDLARSAPWRRRRPRRRRQQLARRSASTAASSSAAGTTAWTRPISRARAAANRAPVRNSSRAADTPILREHERRDHRRQDAELHLGEAEHRVVGGDDDVADRGEAGAAAERRAVDPADERHRQRVERSNIARQRRASRRFSLVRVGDRLRHPGEVGAGAERLAGAARGRRRAASDRSAHARRPRGQLGDHLLVEGVAHLGPVERDALDRRRRAR